MDENTMQAILTELRGIHRELVAQRREKKAERKAARAWSAEQWEALERLRGGG